MPRFPAGATRQDWQIVKREDGWWLQRRLPDGTWSDFNADPYKQRGSALARYRTMERWYLMDVRHDPAHRHTFPTPGTVAPAWERYCLECGLRIEPEEARNGA